MSYVKGEHVPLRCRQCNRTVLEVLLRDPGAVGVDGTPLRMSVQATCCWCGSLTFLVKDLPGRIAPGGVGRQLRPEDPNSYVPETELDGSPEVMADRVLFRTRRVR